MDELRDRRRALPNGSSDEPLYSDDELPEPSKFPGRAFATLFGFVVGAIAVVIGGIAGLSALAHTIVDLVVVGWNAGGWR